MSSKKNQGALIHLGGVNLNYTSREQSRANSFLQQGTILHFSQFYCAFPFVASVDTSFVASLHVAVEVGAAAFDCLFLGKQALSWKPLLLSCEMQPCGFPNGFLSYSSVNKTS